MIENGFEKRFQEVTGEKFPIYFKENNPRLIYYLKNNFTHDEDKSKEYSQRAFMQALEKINIYDQSKAKLLTWITKIAINLVIKDWRDDQRMDSVSFDADIQDTPGFINIIKYDEGDVEREEHSEKVRKCEIIIDTIKSLQTKYKNVMVMREIEKMHYKDIADSIRKETKLVIDKKTHQLQTPEDFYSLDLENKGDSEVKIHFTNGEKSFARVIRPFHSFFVLRDDIDWERSPVDVFNVISNETICNISYITTTNLSTIKSQIKKGRSLVKRKVKRKFDLMNKE